MNTETKEQIRRFQKDTMKFWNGGKEGNAPCIKCWKPSVTLHEIIPRSLYPEWYTDIFNSVPICVKDHEWAHLNGEAGRIELREAAVKRLQTIETWKPDRIVREIDEETDT